MGPHLESSNSRGRESKKKAFQLFKISNITIMKTILFLKKETGQGVDHYSKCSESEQNASIPALAGEIGESIEETVELLRKYDRIDVSNDSIWLI